MAKITEIVTTSVKIELTKNEAEILREIIRESPKLLDVPEDEDPASLELREAILSELGKILS